MVSLDTYDVWINCQNSLGSRIMSYHLSLHTVAAGFIVILLILIPGNLLYAIEHLMTMDRKLTCLCCQTGT